MNEWINEWQRCFLRGKGHRPTEWMNDKGFYLERVTDQLKGSVTWHTIILKYVANWCIWEVLSWWLSQQKIGNFCLTLFPQCELYNHIFFIDFILTYRSRRVIICKNINKKYAHPLSNKIQTFLKILLILLKISYLQN